MYNYKVKIIHLDSRGKEKIIDLKLLETRSEVNEFINKHNAEIKPYKMNKGKKYYELS